MNRRPLTLIEAMVADGQKDARQHWFDEGLEPNDLREASESAAKLERVAIRLVDENIESCVIQAEEAWKEATEADMKRWSKADLLAAYRDGAIAGIKQKLRTKLEDEEYWRE